MSISYRMDKKAVGCAYSRTLAAVKINKLQLKPSTWIVSKLMLKMQVNIKHDSICVKLCKKR